jgi:hypothetical protein
MPDPTSFLVYKREPRPQTSVWGRGGHKVLCALAPEERHVDSPEWNSGFTDN